MSDQTHTFDLARLQVTLGPPRLVTEGIGHCWFPNLTRFPGGELLLTANLSPDAEGNLVSAASVFISTDSGRGWGPSFDVAQMPNMIVACADGALAGPTFHLYPEPAGQGRRFVAHYIRIRADGHYTLLPWHARVEGLPRDVQPSRHSGKWSRRWMGQLYFDGDVVQRGGESLATAYTIFAGEDRYALLLLASTDEGRHWHYVSTIAGPGSAPDGKEGPCEASMIELADGDLMCVMRVGSGPGQWLGRTYSSDGGQSWSPLDRLPAYSVEPSLLRLQNGTLALASGRPGIYLWLSTDLRGQHWEQVNIVEHHNRAVTPPGRSLIPADTSQPEQRHAADQTTAYTQLVEVAPNRLLLAYDRTPFGWKPVPADSEERSQIFVMPIDVER